MTDNASGGISLDRLRLGALQLAETVQEAATTVVNDVRRDGGVATIQRYSQNASQAGAQVITNGRNNLYADTGNMMDRVIMGQGHGQSQGADSPAAERAPPPSSPNLFATGQRQQISATVQQRNAAFCERNKAENLPMCQKPRTGAKGPGM